MRLNLFSWLDGKNLIADMLTKNGRECDSFQEIMTLGKCSVTNNMDNLVYFDDGEVKIENIVPKT